MNYKPWKAFKLAYLFILGHTLYHLIANVAASKVELGLDLLPINANNGWIIKGVILFLVSAIVFGILTIYMYIDWFEEQELAFRTKFDEMGSIGIAFWGIHNKIFYRNPGRR